MGLTLNIVILAGGYCTGGILSCMGCRAKVVSLARLWLEFGSLIAMLPPQKTPNWCECYGKTLFTISHDHKLHLIPASITISRQIASIFSTQSAGNFRCARVLFCTDWIINRRPDQFSWSQALAHALQCCKVRKRARDLRDAAMSARERDSAPIWDTGQHQKDSRCTSRRFKW